MLNRCLGAFVPATGVLLAQTSPREAVSQLLRHQAIADIKGGKHGERRDESGLCNDQADGITDGHSDGNRLDITLAQP